MYALNFYSPIVENQLRSGRKSATIRLGDKSSKYRKGMIVAVLAGARFSPRKKIFDAVIDMVEVKTLGEPLHLDLVDHGVEDLVARPVAGADEHGDDHPLLVLARLVAEPDRRRLAIGPQLGLDDG